jgi:hypothetical protein
MEMAEAIANNQHISIKKAFFGLQTKVVYEPTQSVVSTEQYDYTQGNGDRMRRILAKADANSNIDTLLSQIEGIEKAAMGPFRLEVCASADRHFLAVQPFGFSDFQYKPLADLLVIER